MFLSLFYIFIKDFLYKNIRLFQSILHYSFALLVKLLDDKKISTIDIKKEVLEALIFQ